MAILIPLLLLVSAEIFLRVAGYGYAPGFFVRRLINGREMLVENRGFGRRFFPGDLARTPQPVVLAPRKPAGTARIFVFGESAAMGDPEPAFGLPRMLQAMLELTFPSNRFEVINVAMTAINSHVVREIARDCAPLEGDIWIVYMGNNEVIGPFGSGIVFGRPESLSFIRAALWLKRFRVVQLAESLRRQPPAEWKGLEMFLDHPLRRDDPKMKRVYVHFRENLRAIVRLGGRADAKVIVSTVAVNLGDSPPFASQMSVALSGEKKAVWAREFARGIELELKGEFAKAHDAFLKTQEMAGGEGHGHAELSFHLARCESARGRYDAARAHFNLAKENDALRFRADDEINRSIRELASRAEPNVRLVDAAGTLAAQSSNSIPGARFFHEHVHPTFEGNYEIARALMKEVVPALPPVIRESASAPWPGLEDCARRLAWTDCNRLEVSEEIRGRLQKPPFPSQFGHKERDRALAERIEALGASLTAERVETLIAEYARAVGRSPDDWVLRENFAKLLEARGDAERAAGQWKEVIRLLPHDTHAYCRVGELLAADGQGARAIGYYREALRRDPGLAEARHGLALAFADSGRLAEAERELTIALRNHPRFVEGRINLGKLLLRQGKTNAAKSEFEIALRIDPDNVMAREFLKQSTLGQ